MKRFFIPLTFLILLFTACQTNQSEYENATIIHSITTIDAVNGMTDHQTVVIKDGKILEIGSSDELFVSAEGNEIIDGTGKFLIPGLWDAHVHFSYIEELAPSMFNLFLAYGITSVRDTGGRIEFVKQWKDRAAANPTEAPRVMIAGPLLDGEPNVYDGSSPGRPPLSVGLETVEDVTEMVNRLDSIGVDLLKAYEMLTPEQFEEVMRLAEEKGLKVTGHVPLSMNAVSASNAGLNSMEHMRNLEVSMASNWEDLQEQRLQMLEEGQDDPGGILRSRIHSAMRETAIENYDEERADEVLQVLAENETWQIPTLALNTRSVEKFYTDSEWQETFTLLPDSIEQEWYASAEEGAQSEVSEFGAEYSNWLFNMVGKINEAGITIMAGTDTPIGLLTPGRSLHHELKVMVDAGLTPMEALQAATLNPARYFEMEDELGTIDEGKWADLLILDANPLDDIENTLEINTVIRQGEVYDQEALEEIFERLRNK
ncbi:amidohydrolase family protein [Rhodohalobacter sulfatireducens]|uniref:Amidohydrolase family protein n=1 Tax=Rhodohalobacter sulfatireducens TaxID=2911366 RepID=A0ABS9KEE2_9BACT|nr:amidohydrolase family protein [Rhodohalobacter sulfatireducens]MCG2589219.1 amidohydrolase family protein [Rhodohalobacter sulfatireducens]